MEHFSDRGLPAAFGWTLAANHRALDGYTRMTEAEKEQVIMRCKDARSDREMEQILHSISSKEMPEELTSPSFQGDSTRDTM